MSAADAGSGAEASARLRFGLTEVERWACFSGDYNPIHFDRAQARRVGADALIVHGMLALLSVKSHVATQSLEGPTDWARFKALLRTPIPHATTTSLRSWAAVGGLQFRVEEDCAGGREYFRGRYVAIDAPPIHEGESLARTELSAGQFDQFYRAYGQDHATWSVLDCVVFADFMRTKVAMLQAYLQPQVKRVSDLGDSLTVHVSHSVCFVRDDFAADNAHLGERGFAYDVLVPEVINNHDHLICNLNMPVRTQGRTSMVIELGLMLKHFVEVEPASLLRTRAAAASTPHAFPPPPPAKTLL